MEIIAENEVSDSGEDTVGEDSEDEELFSLRVTMCNQSSKLGPEWYTLVKKVMRCVWDMLLQSMETGKEGLLSTHHIWKGLVKNRSRDSEFYLFLLKRTPPCVRSSATPLFFQGL
jgi:hypothetical protein